MTDVPLVTMFSRTGKVTYSSDPALIGTRPAENVEDARKLVADGAYADISRLDSGQKVVEATIPVDADHDGRVDGGIEIYRDFCTRRSPDPTRLCTLGGGPRRPPAAPLRSALPNPPARAARAQPVRVGAPRSEQRHRSLIKNLDHQLRESARRVERAELRQPADRDRPRRHPGRVDRRSGCLPENAIHPACPGGRVSPPPNGCARGSIASRRSTGWSPATAGSSGCSTRRRSPATGREPLHLQGVLVDITQRRATRRACAKASSASAAPSTPSALGIAMTSRSADS